MYDVDDERYLNPDIRSYRDVLIENGYWEDRVQELEEEYKELEDAYIALEKKYNELKKKGNTNDSIII